MGSSDIATVSFVNRDVMRCDACSAVNSAHARECWACRRVFVAFAPAIGPDNTISEVSMIPHERNVYRFNLPTVEPAEDVLGAIAARVIEQQARHLNAQWRGVIVDALRSEIGGDQATAERLADAVITALSRHVTVDRGPV